MKEDKNKEIDLLDLIRSMGKSIGNFFRFLYDTMWWLIVFGVKHYIYMIVFFALGLTWGIYKNSTTKDVYQSSMKIRSNAMRTHDLKPHIAELNKYLNGNIDITYPILEKALSIDSASLGNIKSIKPHFYIDYWGDGILDEIDFHDKHSTRDTINVLDTTYLCIQAKVQDPLLFNVLGEKIVSFLNSKPVIIERNRFRLEDDTYRANEIKHEIQLLDSLQKFSYFNGSRDLQQLQFNNRTGLILGESRQQLYHWEKIKLEKIRKPMLTRLDLYRDPVSIIDDFSVETNKVESSSMEILKSIILVSALGYLILLLIYFFRRNYAKYADKV